jgi:hypothetical protein
VTEKPPETPGGTTWLDASLALGLITALVATAGWAYAQAWYAMVDLGLTWADIQPMTFAMYGFFTLQAHAWWLLPLLIGATIAWRLYAHRLPVWASRWFGVALPPATLALFWGAYTLGAAVGRADYRADAESGFCSYPYVRVALDSSASLPDSLKAVPEQAAGQQLRLLVQTPAFLVLIAPELGSPPLLVPMGQVRMMRVIPVPAGCRP